MNGFDFSKSSGFLLIALLLALWETVSRWVWGGSHHLPPASQIIQCIVSFAGSSEMVNNVLTTLRRLLMGYALGICIGYCLGFWCGYIPRIYSLLEWVIEYVRPMPSVALIPVGILFLGIGDLLNVAIVAWACSWPVFVNTMDGVSTVDPILLATSRTFGCSKLDTITKIIVPSSLPSVFTGLRVSLGVAFAVVVITEMVASGTGLGAFILATSLSYRIPEMYAGIILIGIMGYILNRGFLLVERRILGWQKRFLVTGR